MAIAETVVATLDLACVPHHHFRRMVIEAGLRLLLRDICTSDMLEPSRSRVGARARRAARW